MYIYNMIYIIWLVVLYNHLKKKYMSESQWVSDDIPYIYIGK